MASANAGVLGVTAIKPPEYHGWEAVKMFFYDSEKGEYMGRTGKSWALIILFYIIYYTLLAAFWALMLFIFLQTIESDRPKWQGDESLIGSSPGVGIVPTQPDATIDSSMIIFNKDKKRMSAQSHVPGYETWTHNMNKFLKQRYSDDASKACSPGDDQDHFEQHGNEPCNFDTNLLGDCGKQPFGYNEGKPCIFLKLNRLYGVRNEHYNGSIPFPEEMPTELVDHVRAQKEDKNQVWIDCHGENPADVESLGKISYYPKTRGFPAYYFPYLNQVSCCRRITLECAIILAVSMLNSV